MLEEIVGQEPGPRHDPRARPESDRLPLDHDPRRVAREVSRSRAYRERAPRAADKPRSPEHRRQALGGNVALAAVDHRRGDLAERPTPVS
jgi:hypothetical protein